MEIVDFNLAKKLKDKGFNWFCSHYYRTKCKDLFLIIPSEDWSNTKERINAPTISQVLKWLREEKKIYVMIDRSFSVENSWHYVICNNDDFEHLIQQESIPNRTWEQAALAGIEYVINYLI